MRDRGGTVSERHTGGHCPYEDLAAGGAVYALEPEEDAVLAEHLPHCQRCREVLISSREAAAYLGTSISQEDPPPRLRDRVLALAAQTPQVSDERGVDEGEWLLRRPESAPGAEIVPIERHQVTRMRKRTRILTAAAAVVLIGISAVLGIRVAQLSHERDTQIAASARMSSVLKAVGDPSAETIVLRDGDRRAATLVATERSAMMLPGSLPPNDADHVYVMWGTDRAKPVPLTTFDVPANADAPMTLRWSPGDVRHATYALSLEKGHSAPELPTHVVASGRQSAA